MMVTQFQRNFYSFLVWHPSILHSLLTTPSRFIESRIHFEHCKNKYVSKKGRRKFIQQQNGVFPPQKQQTQLVKDTRPFCSC